jgi:molybdopterin molybdotransferase
VIVSENLSVQEAQAIILKNLQPVGEERLPLASCAGRILAEEISAGADLPPFANSSMDGFAVITGDIAAASPQSPVVLAIAADIPAGSTPSIRLQTGQAARIMTGAMIPAGADAVVPVENTGFAPHLAGDQAGAPLPHSVAIFSPEAPGANIRPRAQDVKQGQVLLTSGRRLLPQDIGILASAGYASVTVYRRPLVALFSSGDELVQPGQPLQGGQIYDSNQFLLAALLEQAGAHVLRLGTAPDNPEAIRALLDQAVNEKADLIVTSAGVSVGAFDFVRQMIESNGSLHFWKVNMRPGKPLAFGAYAGIPFIGLPGNPVSAYVGCRVFVFPAVQRLAGQPDPGRWKQKAHLGEPVKSDGRESYLRAVVQEEDGRLVARLTGHQGSGNLYSLVQANALLIVPSGVKSLPSDSEVDVWFLDAE